MILPLISRGTVEAIFAGNARPIETFVDALQPVSGQVGATFSVGGRIVGLDVFDSEVTLRKLLPKLIRSAAVDAIDDGAGSNVGTDKPPVVFAEAAQFLAALRDADGHDPPALGLGQELRLTAPGLTGAALVVEGRAVHVSAFAHSVRKRRTVLGGVRTADSELRSNYLR